jgi:hypothetical protein
MYRQEYLIYHDHWSKHLVPYLEQRHKVGHMSSYNQMNTCHYYVNSYNSMNSQHYMRIHTSSEFMLCWRNSLFEGAIIFFTFGAVNVADSHVCLWMCTDARQVLQRRSVCSSPTLLTALLSNGGSCCQGSGIAVSDVHEFMYQHECRLLCNTRPTDQLVAYVGQPGDCLW